MKKISVLLTTILFCLSVFGLGCGKKSTIRPNKDTSPPVVSISQPESGEVLLGTVTILLDAHDDRGITYSELYFNGMIVLIDSANTNQYEWDTTEWDDGDYAIHVLSYDAAGNVGTSNTVNVEVHNQFLMVLYNFIFTPIQVNVDEQGDFTIEPFDSLELIYDVNPGTITYTAETYGQSSEGIQLGSAFSWDVTEDVTGTFSLYHSLDIDSAWFFLYVRNTGSAYLYPFYINYDTQYEIEEDILIPPDGDLYSLGYYRAFQNTQIRADIVGIDDVYRLWKQAVDFTLPFTSNQYALLTNTFLAKHNGYLPKPEMALTPRKVTRFISREKPLSRKYTFVLANEIVK